jgi:hypothetical protein
MSLLPPTPLALVARARGSLHDRFGWHLVDHGHSHWEEGEFLSRCSICRRVMIKHPGEQWRVRRVS